MAAEIINLIKFNITSLKLVNSTVIFDGQIGGAVGEETSL